MRLGEIGLDGEGLGDEINGNIVFSHLMGDHTKQMQGVRLIGVGLQYLLIDGLGLFQAALSVMPQGEVQGLLDVRGMTRGLSTGGRQAPALPGQSALAVFFCSAQWSVHVSRVGRNPDNRIPIPPPGELRLYPGGPNEQALGWAVI